MTLPDAITIVREQQRRYEIFTPLSKTEVEQAVAAVRAAIGDAGSDRLHAQWARLLLDNTVKALNDGADTG